MSRSRQMPELYRTALAEVYEESTELQHALDDAEAEVARLTAQLTMLEQARLAEVIPGGAFQLAESWMARALQAEAQVAQLRREAERALSASKFTALMQKATAEYAASALPMPYRKRATKAGAQ